jgi:predicted transposase/invertase (TIGR01784 family)
MELSSAMMKAIDDCISQNVLKEFLERNASEVRNMLFGWNWDTAKEVWQEEAREDGVAIGEARGIAIGRNEGILRTARQMKAKGLSLALIAEVTGLSEVEIEELD